MNDDQKALANFSGMARLFPLPNLVLFPHVVQPLHVFEPRYRQMTADALAGDNLMALALLQPGWEEEYNARPAIHPVACLGRVIANQLLNDGRYNLLVRGLSRIRLRDEAPNGKLYRAAHAELLTDELPAAAETKRLRRELGGRALSRFPDGPARQQMRDLLHGKVSLGVLCDILSFALPLAVEQKQELLGQLDVRRRAEYLLEQLDTLVPAEAEAADRKFPPDFSAN